MAEAGPLFDHVLARGSFLDQDCPVLSCGPLVNGPVEVFGLLVDAICC